MIGALLDVAAELIPLCAVALAVVLLAHVHFDSRTWRRLGQAQRDAEFRREVDR